MFHSNSVAMARPAVLIVEDEFLIAMQIEEDVRALGYDVAAVAGSSRKALDLLRDNEVGFALLDVNLVDGSVAPVAQELTARHVPFLFLTGYGPQGVSEAFPHAPVLRKPVQAGVLGNAIRDVLDS